MARYTIYDVFDAPVATANTPMECLDAAVNVLMDGMLISRVFDAIEGRDVAPWEVKDEALGGHAAAGDTPNPF